MPLTDSQIKLYYEDHGQGDPPLLMLPAWCMSHKGYAQLPQKCAAHRRVISLDWRGHGQSAVPTQDFAAEGLVEDALAIIEATGLDQVIPVTMSHSGWVGIELRRRLGSRIPKLVHTDWLMIPPPPPYLDLVHGLAAETGWEQARDILFSIWLEGVDNPDVIQFVRSEMGAYGSEMWRRSGRAIGECYETGGYPLQALATLDPPIPVLHLYAQPKDPGYLAAQQDFSAANPWYEAKLLDAVSHFPTFESPDEMAAIIEEFVSAK